MTPKFFVEALKTECRDAAVRGCVEQLQKPVGRSPSIKLTRLSKWFNSLDEVNQSCVLEAMQEAADATLFGVLCVIDGVRTIEQSGEKSGFRLTAHRAGIVSEICPGELLLHDMVGVAS